MIIFRDAVLAAAPQSVRTLLWDLDPARVSSDQAEILIPRLLIADDPSVLRWLRDTVGDHAIRAWILATRGGGLAALDLHPWVVAFGIAPDAVDWHPETALSYASPRTEE